MILQFAAVCLIFRWNGNEPGQCLFMQGYYNSCFVDTHLPRSHWSSNLYSLSLWQHSHMCTAKSSLSGISPHENEGHTHSTTGRVTFPSVQFFVCLYIYSDGGKYSQHCNNNNLKYPPHPHQCTTAQLHQYSSHVHITRSSSSI